MVLFYVDGQKDFYSVNFTYCCYNFRKLRSAEERFEKIIADVAEVVTGELKNLDVSKIEACYIFSLVCHYRK